MREHFDGMYLNHDAARGVIQTYGMDRVMLVLANTVQLQDWDGRYAPAVREVRRVQTASPGLPLFFFARIVAFWWGVIDNGVRNEVMADVDV